MTSTNAILVYRLIFGTIFIASVCFLLTNFSFSHSWFVTQQITFWIFSFDIYWEFVFFLCM